MVGYDLWWIFAYFCLHKTRYDIAPQKNALMVSTCLHFHNELREQKAMHVPEYLQDQGM